ncbi:MAG TPA: TlpA disulfide reductase family protein [Pyrinomonadaceae bacterium]|nr:TlpA disulfide reductase family protein [Pyrinomonadaceae bacterium]
MISTSRRSMVAATFLFLMAFSGLALTPQRRAHAAQEQVDFQFRSIDGQAIGASEVRGQVVVLAIGASWLPLSRKQAQNIRKLANEYGKRGVVVYWVSTDSESPKSKNYASDEQLRAFSRRHDMNITILRDPDAGIVKQMGVSALPAVVILDKQGRVFRSPITGLDPEGELSKQLAEPLEELLK